MRNWLRTESGNTDIPGAEFIAQRYRTFQRDLPRFAAVAHLNPPNLSYVDYCFAISEWLKENSRG